MNAGSRLLTVLVILAVLVGVHGLAFRPWMRTWGSTRAEQAAVWPGDELWPEARRVETRAVTIDAPRPVVWAWIAQLGQDRGGFYSYTLLENLAGAEMSNADRLLGLPDPEVGDRLWMAPPAAFGGVGYALVARVEKPAALVLLVHSGSDPLPTGTWAFLLEAAGPDRTRLVARGRSGHPGAGFRPVARLAAVFGFDPLHFVMERGLMLGVKARAEGRTPPDARFDAEALCWLVILAAALLAGILAVVRTGFGPPVLVWAGGLAAALVLPLIRPPLFLTVAIALAVAAAALAALLDRRPAPEE